MQPRTPIIVGAFFAALLAGLVIRFFGPQLSASVPMKEHFAQRSVGMPVDFSQPVAPFDGTSPILGSEAKPISQKPYDMADDSIRFLATTKVGAECCPSVFSSDTGCLCLSDDEKRAMASRGGNRAEGQFA